MVVPGLGMPPVSGTAFVSRLETNPHLLLVHDTPRGTDTLVRQLSLAAIVPRILVWLLGLLGLVHHRLCTRSTRGFRLLTHAYDLSPLTTSRNDPTTL